MFSLSKWSLLNENVSFLKDNTYVHTHFMYIQNSLKWNKSIANVFTPLKYLKERESFLFVAVK